MNGLFKPLLRLLARRFVAEDHASPAVTRVRLAGGKKRGEELDSSVIGREHLRDTVSGLLASSELISLAVAEGKLAIVGANYTLAEGRVTPDVIIGSIAEDPLASVNSQN